MTLKSTSPAGRTVLIEELPLFLKEEMATFMERNRISGNKCCPWCLKAHLIGKAKEKDMEGWAIWLIDQILPERTGHNGYYLDGEEIKGID